MKKIILLSLFAFFTINQNVFSQSWKLLSRQQKDSVIYNYFDKGDKYIALNMNSVLAFGAWSGSALDIGLAYGKFIKKRHLIAANTIFRKAKLQLDDNCISHNQYTIGTFYRFYLPERKTYTTFFAHGEIDAGVFYGKQLNNEEESNIKFGVLNIMVGFGISIPINKYNIEIGMKQEFRIINQSKYYKNRSSVTDGIIGISYVF